MKVVVIIPTYNEKGNMERMIPVLEDEVFPKITKDQMYILVADDKSPDGTADVIKNYMKKYKNLELLIGDKQGLGAAYVRAMHYAMDKMDADAVVEFDADFQHDPHDIPRLVAAFDEGYDYVIGSRYVPGGAIPKEWGLHRKILSSFGGLFARIVWLRFNVHDMTSGYKLTRTSFLRKIDLDHLLSKYYAYKMHILHDMLSLHAKVKEVPIVFYERKEGSSKITRKDLFDSFYVVIMLRLRDSARFIKFLFVGGTGFLVQVLAQEGSVRLGVAHPIAAGIGAETAILSNFLFNHFWTFSDTGKVAQSSNFFVKLVKFNVASLASIFIQAAAVWLGEKIFSPNMQLGPIAAPTRIVVLFPTIIFIVLPLNYIIYNKLIWKTQYLKHDKALKA